MKSSCRITLFTAVLAAFALPPTLRAQTPAPVAPPAAESYPSIQEIEHKVLLKQFKSALQELTEAEKAISMATTAEQKEIQQRAFVQLKEYTVQLKAQLAALESANNPKDSALKNKLDAIRIPRVSFEDATISEMIEFLVLRGKEFDPDKTGVNLVLMDKENKSTVTCNLQNVTLHSVLKIAAEQAGLTLDIGDEIVALRKPTGKPTTSASSVVRSDNNPKDSALKNKLDTIRIPTVQFEDVTISELVEFLRFRGKELDPDKTGVNLVLMDKENKSTVTFHLKNATMHTVLKIAAGQAGLTLDIGDDTVSLRKPTGNQAAP